jgi:hypothetical protein
LPMPATILPFRGLIEYTAPFTSFLPTSCSLRPAGGIIHYQCAENARGDKTEKGREPCEYLEIIRFSSVDEKRDYERRNRGMNRPSEEHISMRKCK